MSSPEAAPAVRCDGLTRRYGERVALDAVSLTIAQGERLLLTGGNGAGKTTLLRVLATVLRPHAGEVAIDGHVLPRDARKVRPAIGYVGHEPLVYPVLTARENLELYAALYGVGRERIEQVLELAGLDGRGGDPAGELSRGLRQRLGLARAMLHSPSLLLLDEPTTGLDEDGRKDNGVSGHNILSMPFRSNLLAAFTKHSSVSELAVKAFITLHRTWSILFLIVCFHGMTHDGI